MTFIIFIQRNVFCVVVVVTVSIFKEGFIIERRIIEILIAHGDWTVVADVTGTGPLTEIFLC